MRVCLLSREGHAQGARFKTGTEVRCPPACFSCSRSVPARRRVHLHGFTLLSPTCLLVLARRHFCILSRPARQPADMLQQFSSRCSSAFGGLVYSGPSVLAAESGLSVGLLKRGSTRYFLLLPHARSPSSSQPPNHINPQPPCTSSPLTPAYHASSNPAARA